MENNIANELTYTQKKRIIKFCIRQQMPVSQMASSIGVEEKVIFNYINFFIGNKQERTAMSPKSWIKESYHDLLFNNFTGYFSETKEMDIGNFKRKELYYEKNNIESEGIFPYSDRFSFQERLNNKLNERENIH